MNALLAVLAVGAAAMALGLISDWYYERQERLENQESPKVPVGLKTA